MTKDVLLYQTLQVSHSILDDQPHWLND